MRIMMMNHIADECPRVPNDNCPVVVAVAAVAAAVAVVAVVALAHCWCCSSAGGLQEHAGFFLGGVVAVASVVAVAVVLVVAVVAVIVLGRGEACKEVGGYAGVHMVAGSGGVVDDWKVQAVVLAVAAAVAHVPR
jgi:hypothetical protein